MRKISNKALALKRKVDKAKEIFVRDADAYCQSCGRTDVKLSVAHVVSEKDCGEMGKDELRWSPENFRLLCFGDSDSCHNIWDNRGVEEKRDNLGNFEEMMEYLQEHNPEKYNLWTIILRDR